MHMLQLMVHLIAHDNPQKRFACAINEEKLYDEYVGDLKNNYTIDKIK